MPYFSVCDYLTLMNIYTLVVILAQVIEWFSLIVIIRVILSWIPVALHSKPGQLIVQIVEPALSPFQKVLPPIYGIDLSPLALILTLEVIRFLIISLAI